MPASLTLNRRTRRTFYSDRVEALGVSAWTVYNHMLLATAFRSLEEDYHHLVTHVQLWDVGAQRQVELRGPDDAQLAQLMTPCDLGRAVVGQCLYAPLVDEGGGMVNDSVVLKLAEDRLWLSIADSDVALWPMRRHRPAGRALHSTRWTPMKTATYSDPDSERARKKTQ